MRYILLFLFLLLTPSSASAVWFDSNWAYRVPVEVVPSKVGSSTAITNFPVYVDLSELPASFLDNVQSSGADIRVTKADGSTEVAFEVVTTGIDIVNTASQIITTSTTTWQIPPDAVSNVVTVEAWGAGGGGGDGANTGGGGGGGGAYARSTLTLATSTNYAITVGTGGAKGAATSAGGFGATTTFNGGQVSAQGGRGGAGCSATNCAGGAGGLASASVGSSTYDGGTGGQGLNSGDLGGGGGGAAGSTGSGGNGSNQTAGIGTAEGGSGGNGGANAGAGANGFAPGGGGGGGEENATKGTGNGADGQVKITYSVATTTEYSDGELHFLADSLSTTSTSTFYIYYGNPSASAYAPTDTYGRNAVWVQFEAVHHLHNSSVDSTANLRNGTDTSITYGTAKLSRGAFNTDKNGKIATGSWSLGAAFSVTGWIKMDSLVDLNTFFSTYNGSGVGSGTAQGYASSETANGNPIYSNFSADSSPKGTIPLVVDTWAKLDFTHDGTTVRIYIDGNEVDTGTVAHATTTRVFNWMSRGDETTQRLDGYIDEVRVYNGQRPVAWLITEYNNQSSPSTFLWIGAEECDGACPGGGGGDSTDAGIIWFD